MKSWPKVQLGQLSYYLLQFDFIHPYLAPKYNLVLFAYIYHYLPIFGCI